MRYNHEILREFKYKNSRGIEYEEVLEVMKEARIDTLEHLRKQFKVNEKKLSPTACIGLIEELIKEIQR